MFLSTIFGKKKNLAGNTISAILKIKRLSPSSILKALVEFKWGAHLSTLIMVYMGLLIAIYAKLGISFSP